LAPKKLPPFGRRWKLKVLVSYCMLTQLVKTWFIKKFNEANAAGLKHIDVIVATHPFDLYDLKKYYTLHMNYLLDEKKKKAMEFFLEVIGEGRGS